MEEVRQTALDFLKKQLFGPANGEDEEISGKPFWRYFTGMLFPSEIDLDSLGESDEPDAKPIYDADDLTDPSLGMAYASAPSSMGISFFVTGAETLRFLIEGGRYERTTELSDARNDNGNDPKKNNPIKPDTDGNEKLAGGDDRGAPKGKIGRQEVWRRVPLASPDQREVVTISIPKKKSREIVIKVALDGRARVSVLFRPRAGGFLVTASLVNVQKPEKKRLAAQIEKMLFQCRFEVEIDEGSIGEYPTIVRRSKHPEDEELSVLYRKRKTFGIGHGCASVWDPSKAAGGLHRLVAEPLPVTEVRGLTNDIDLPEEAIGVLSLQWLAMPSRDVSELRGALDAFLDAYEDWTDRQCVLAGTLDASMSEAAKRLLERQRRALGRMRDGVDLLCSSPEARLAFRIAQEAMLRQFLWSRRRGRSPLPLGAGKVAQIDPWESEHANDPRWRPFQLAFQLLVIPSVFDLDHEDRDVFDLLWFPTGGGKTEAYLAIAAFDMVVRRHRYFEAGAGTSVIMRYTLRLLTAQQFERCATLISALESMRVTQKELGLGDTPFRLGLWVGADTSPNRLTQPTEKSPGAVQLFDRLLKDRRPENPFHLNACPACGTRIVPKELRPRNEYGLDITEQRFRMFCPDSRCLLHDEIPVSVVDDDLYNRPPTFLIGTIDKFARMVWDARSRVFFGLGVQGGDLQPPALIIQDELHLITGPLGTIAGTYEAAIDTLLGLKGARPKYLAATATIQRAPEQVKALYARDVFIFPPSGLDCDDSFFTKEDSKSPGRAYLGAMGHGLYSALTALVQVSAAAAACPVEIDEAITLSERPVPARDSYWTQVIYHNSRQELGKTTTMLRDDVKTRLGLLQPIKEKRRPFDSVEELSANLKGASIGDTLERLQIELPSRDAIDALACTNMISVGVDISRLGLMIIKSQPKSTAEYIQASSRVGRNPKRPPGVVIALYAANRPRDRSHYEDFQSYHSSLYRAVEPVTVTPFSAPALDRTLHAALVLPIRHLKGWLDPKDAANFDPDETETKSIIAALKARLSAAARTDEVGEVLDRLDALISEWSDEVQKNPGLVFDGGRQYSQLLCPFPVETTKHGLWPTLNSMRHVDGEAGLELKVGE